MSIALSVPANLLVIGEYAVTEEGGIGVALACSPRAYVEAKPRAAGGLRIAGRMGASAFVWSEGDSPTPPLIAACMAAVGAPAPGRRFGNAEIDIDSSAFFARDGSKLGFGSSAAVAVGLCAALFELLGSRGGGPEWDDLVKAVFTATLSAHRLAQGGRGSGYDVAASCFGGAGIFEGGASPGWSPLPDAASASLSSLDLSLRAGPAPVSSAQAVGKYAEWKARDTAAHRDFVAASAAAARRLVAARDAEAALAALALAAEIGAKLGDAIGVPARPLRRGDGSRRAAGNTKAVEKCLGAGDELVLVASLRDGGNRTTGPLELRVENEGLRWE